MATCPTRVLLRSSSPSPTQDGIADIVAQGVVDGLDMVHVDDDDGHPGDCRSLRCEEPLEQAAVADAREGILFSRAGSFRRPGLEIPAVPFEVDARPGFRHELFVCRWWIAHMMALTFRALSSTPLRSRQPPRTR